MAARGAACVTPAPPPYRALWGTTRYCGALYSSWPHEACHICAGTGPTAATSAPGLGSSVALRYAALPTTGRASRVARDVCACVRVRGRAGMPAVRIFRLRACRAHLPRTDRSGAQPIAAVDARRDQSHRREQRDLGQPPSPAGRPVSAPNECHAACPCGPARAGVPMRACPCGAGR